MNSPVRQPILPLPHLLFYIHTATPKYGKIQIFFLDVVYSALGRWQKWATKRNLAMENDWNLYELIDEIYAIQRKISMQFGSNICRIAEAVKEWRRRDEAAGVKYVRLPIANVAPSMA